MKTKLLRKLRKNIHITYYPETNKNRDYWVVVNKDSWYSSKTYFSFKEALSQFHSYLSTNLSRYMDSQNKIQIL